MDNESVRRYFWIFLNLFIVAAIINVIFFVMPAISRFAGSLQPARTITVSAEGKTTVTPDLATASFSVVSQGKNPDDLATDNNKKVTAVITFVKSQGIDAKDIQTTGYSLAPDYQYDENTRRSYITGYTLTQTVTVKIRDLAKVAKVIGGVTPLGVNQIGNVSFTVEDEEKYLATARADAFMKAQRKASDMAAQSGVRLGEVTNVYEYQNGPISYYADTASSKVLGMGGGTAPSAAPTIEPGTQEVKLSVSITYAIR
jgi:hypothetical protein